MKSRLDFATGDVTLSLHPATPTSPAGSVELGFHVDRLEQIHAQGEASGVTFTSAPRRQHGVLVASFPDCEGTACSASE
jgi:hypothetical protein